MKTYLKQAAYIVIGSIAAGILVNTLRLNNLPLLAKSINGFSNNFQDNEFVIETIDLEIARKLFYDKVPFIDARDSISFIKGHINDAILQTPYYEMIDRIFIKQGFNGPIVVYCDDGECGLSEDLAYRLQAEGFSKIYVFTEGWNKWLLADLPVEK
jgi:rhodanese-related sulfurtransferase